MMKAINYVTCIDPLLRDVRRHIPVFAGMKPGDTVLDVCCGSGAQISEYINRGIVAQGADNNPQMIDLARRYYFPNNSGASALKLTDAASLPFPDGYFDFTSISLAFHDKDETTVNRIMAEMKRVTRKNGLLVFADYSFPLPGNLPGFVIRVIERLAGGEHYMCFRNYLENGGLHKVLDNNSIIIVKETVMKNGCITIASGISS